MDLRVVARARAENVHALETAPRCCATESSLARVLGAAPERIMVCSWRRGSTRPIIGCSNAQLCNLTFGLGNRRPSNAARGPHGLAYDYRRRSDLSLSRRALNQARRALWLDLSILSAADRGGCSPLATRWVAVWVAVRKRAGAHSGSVAAGLLERPVAPATVRQPCWGSTARPGRSRCWPIGEASLYDSVFVGGRALPARHVSQAVEALVPTATTLPALYGWL